LATSLRQSHPLRGLTAQYGLDRKAAAGGGDGVPPGAFNLHSLIAVPLIARGRTLGAIVMLNVVGYILSENDPMLTACWNLGFSIAEQAGDPMRIASINPAWEHNPHLRQPPKIFGFSPSSTVGSRSVLVCLSGC
jgi:hypothetical protein